MLHCDVVLSAISVVVTSSFEYRPRSPHCSNLHHSDFACEQHGFDSVAAAHPDNDSFITSILMESSGVNGDTEGLLLLSKAYGFCFFFVF